MPKTKETKAEEKAPAARKTPASRKRSAAAKDEPAKKEAKDAPAAQPKEKAAEPKPAKTPVRTRVASPRTKDKAAPAPAEAPAPAPRKNARPEAVESAPAPAPESPAPAASENLNGYAAPETVGGHEPQGNGGHRKRRRRNRRGGENAAAGAPGRHAQVDPDELVRRAWKIYLGEVTEEGLALMDDRTAAEAARRSFRVAELFLIEASHHRPSAAAPTPEAEKPEPPVGEEA